MSSKVLLLNGPVVEEKADKLEMSNRILRLGVASLIAYLNSQKVETNLFDPVTQGRSTLKKIVSDFRPDIIGLHAYTSEIHAAAQTSKYMKSLQPEVVTVVGGPHVSAVPQKTLEQFPSFDIVVVGEGERTLTEIAKKEKSLKDISGICFRLNNQIVCTPERPLIKNINTLPYPPWQLFNLKKYRGSDLISGYGNLIGKFLNRKASLELPVEGARGCPYGCIFCFRTMGRKIRFKSAKRIVDEVQRNVCELGANKIHFIEGTFGVNQEIAKEMCKELIRRRLHKKITWSSGGRVNCLQDRTLLELMKKSGCEYLGIGVESGDEELLHKIGKGISLPQIKRAFRLCQEVGITTEAEFILGHPFETEKTIKKTIDLALSLPAGYATFAILVPFPGTKVAQMAETGVGGLKILSRDWRLYGKQIGESLELDQLPHEKLLEYQATAYKRFYLRPSRIPALISRLNKERIKFGIKNLVN